MDIITSLKNERVKLANMLQTRARARRKERKIVLEGTRLIQDALERNHKPHYVLYDPQKADYNLIAQVQAFDLIPVSDEVIQHVSDTQNPQGIVAVFPMPVPPLPKHPRRVLILDNVRDPGNTGTMLRTAAAAGVQMVILSPGCVDPYNPKVLRGGMGAHFRVPIVEAGWDEINDYCGDLNIYLTAGSGDTAYDKADWTSPWAVIIGSEAHGITKDAKQIAQKRVFIPMAAGTESLNAAVAAGVVLFEAARQRQ